LEIPKGLLGEAIKKARNEKKLTQAALAELIGVSTNHVQNLENGRKKPSYESFISLIDALDISIDALLTDPDDRALELRNMINNGLNHCSIRDMSMIYTMIEAMREKEPEDNEEDKEEDNEDEIGDNSWEISS